MKILTTILAMAGAVCGAAGVIYLPFADAQGNFYAIVAIVFGVLLLGVVKLLSKLEPKEPS